MTPSGGTLTALVGLLTLRLTVDGSFQRYVRSGMRPWLLLAGVGLLVLGIFTLVRALRSPPEMAVPHGGAGEAPDRHDHEQSVRVGWLLLVPVTALLLVAPPSLGSFGVDRSTLVRVSSGRSSLPPLDHTNGPHPMTLQEFTERSFDHDGASLRGHVVSLTGFVAGGGAGSDFRLARYQIACCAADAAASVVRVTGVTGAPPARDRWVTIVGIADSTRENEPGLIVSSLQEIPAPEDPYE